ELLNMALALTRLTDEEVGRRLGALDVTAELHDVVHRPFELTDDHGDATVALGAETLELVRMPRSRALRDGTEGEPGAARAGCDPSDGADAEPVIGTNADGRDEDRAGEGEAPRQKIVVTVGLHRRRFGRVLRAHLTGRG